MIDDREVEITSPREALRLGLGMVYQHFTLVPSMSVFENLVLARAEIPMVLHWRREERALAALMARMPFRVDLGAPVHSLSAGEKQKVEILKQLFLERRIVILDEPTSVLTPDESDEVLCMLQQMTRDGVLSVLLITHKFREVMRFADRYTVLRNGKVTGSGAVREVSPKHLAELMIGNEEIAAPAERRAGEPGETRLEVRGLSLHNERGVPAVRDLSFSIRAGEILGIAGVSGNGQRELAEVLSGSRARIAGGITAHGAPYRATRREMRRHGVYCLVEEPLKNACVPGMSVAENMALRRFDRAPHERSGPMAAPLGHHESRRSPHRTFRRETTPARGAHRGALRRQRAARGPGAGVVGGGPGAHRRQPLLRPRLRRDRGDPRKDHGGP